MATKVQIENGTYNLFECGSLIADSSIPVIITLKGDGELEFLKFIIRFINEEKDPNVPRKKAKVLDPSTLEVTFTNYNNILGAFNKDYWEVGTLNNRKLYLVYFICGQKGSKLKKITYSFYLGEEVANG